MTHKPVAHADGSTKQPASNPLALPERHNSENTLASNPSRRLSWAPSANLSRKNSKDSIYSIVPRKDPSTIALNPATSKADSPRTAAELLRKRDRDEAVAASFCEALDQGRSWDESQIIALNTAEHLRAEETKQAITAEQAASSRLLCDDGRKRRRLTGASRAGQTTRGRNDRQCADDDGAHSSHPSDSSVDHFQASHGSDGSEDMAERSEHVPLPSVPATFVNDAPMPGPELHQEQLQPVDLTQAEPLERGRARKRAPTGVPVSRRQPSNSAVKNHRTPLQPILSSAINNQSDSRMRASSALSTQDHPAKGVSRQPMNAGKLPLAPSYQRIRASSHQPIQAESPRPRPISHFNLDKASKNRKASAPRERLEPVPEHVDAVQATLTPERSHRTRLKKHVSSGFRRIAAMSKAMSPGDAHQRSDSGRRRWRRSRKWSNSNEA